MLGDERSFGLLIAFIIPGWIGLLGLSYLYPLFDTWLSGSMESNPSVGGFLFATLASIALGTGFSTVRWLILDPLLNLTLPRAAPPDFQQLRHTHEALRLLIESHYRFYQFHGNLIVALAIAAPIRWHVDGSSPTEATLIVCVVIVLILGARDTKQKYDRRMTELMLSGQAIEAASTTKEAVVLPEDQPAGSLQQGDECGAVAAQVSQTPKTNAPS